MKVTDYRMIIVDRAIRRAFGDEIEIHLDYRTGKFGVNWGAFGTVDPAKTVEFSQNLMAAAFVANALTKMNIKIEYVEYAELGPVEQEEVVMVLAESISNQHTRDVERYLETGKV